MTPADYPDFRSANERYFLICASTCVANNPPYWQSRRLIMPVKYSVVKDLDCISNRLSGQAQRVVDLVGLGGIEPPTSPLSGVRSSHLSYRPKPGHWWSWSGSNRRPPECKSGALPAELQPLLPSAKADKQKKFSRPVG